MLVSFGHLVSHSLFLFFQFLGLDFDVHMSIFVSPIVFPLAFSINGMMQEYYIEEM